MARNRPKILVVLPTMWDRKQLEACRADWAERYEFEFAQPSDADCSAWFDALTFIRNTAARGDLAGVISSSDYPGATVAAGIAAKARLPGPDPAALMRAAQKVTSRELQRATVPEATPRFCLVDPDNLREPEIGFPCFVKPVKGAFSMFARRVDSMPELRAHLDRPEVREFRTEFLAIFNSLWQHYVAEPINGRFFIAEEVLTGAQVTVEGFVADAEPTICGVVDSEFHPGGRSFSRFVYPSRLPGEVQARMADIARRCIIGMGLRHCCFNIEMTWDAATGRIGIIEVNPRICGQFGDLYQKVDGANAYVALAELANGDTPHWPRGKGPFRYAASVPLRVFQPSRLVAAPDDARVREVEAAFPGTLVWNEYAAGTLLDEFAFEDGASQRYAVINLGAESPEALQEKAREVVAALGYRVEPISP